MFTLPTEGRYIQPNKGTRSGNVFASYGVDFSTDPGVMETSAPVLEIYQTSDDVDFDGYASAILQYKNRYIAVSGKAFSSLNPTTGWSEMTTTGDEPDSTNQFMDAVVFDDLLLVSTVTDIKAYDNTSWSSWWQTTLGESALSTSNINGKHILRVGPQGDLFIVDVGQKVYRKNPTAAAVTSGNGTLDLTDTDYVIRCMEPSSNRMWLGTENRYGNEAVIIEWDMSENSSTANKYHPIGSSGVFCIAIWNDTPIALLRNGTVKYFNGSTFVDWEGAQMPFANQDDIIDDNFVTSNGWAIIDNLPHFLLKGGILTSDGAILDEASGEWYMPAGVWCLDPQVGLYHRFSVGYSSSASQTDYGSPALKEVGALYALDSADAKFLASYEIYTQSSSATSVLAAHNTARDIPTRSFLVTPFIGKYGEVCKDVREHYCMNDGDQIDVYYRTKNQDKIVLSGTWYTTTQLNTTDDTSSVSVGDHLLIMTGNGAGTFVKIAAINRGASVDEITVAEAPINIAAGETSYVQALNFKHFKTITNADRIEDSFSFPESKKVNKVQVLFRFSAAAGSKILQEYSIIN